MKSNDLVLIALGANLPSAAFGPPRATCEAALEEFWRRGVRVLRRSPWYESEPVPTSSQPWYVNGVVAVATSMSAETLLQTLHRIEEQFGRVRREANEARVIDLDLLAYGRLVRQDPPVLPHPRMHDRAFVILPLADIAPDWRHPVDGRSAAELAARLPPGQPMRRMADEG